NDFDIQVGLSEIIIVRTFTILSHSSMIGVQAIWKACKKIGKGVGNVNAIALAAIGIFIFILGYRFYSKFVAEKIFRLDPNYVTPAHRFKDGVDFVPTNK